MRRESRSKLRTVLVPEKNGDCFGIDFNAVKRSSPRLLRIAAALIVSWGERVRVRTNLAMTQEEEIAASRYMRIALDISHHIDPLLKIGAKFHQQNQLINYQ